MKVPRPWHAKALELRASGLSLVKTASECDISLTQLKRFLDPNYRNQQYKIHVERREERMKTDPTYRAHIRMLANKRRKVQRLRTAAKCEAYDTGRRYEDVCAAWDIAP